MPPIAKHIADKTVQDPDKTKMPKLTTLTPKKPIPAKLEFGKDIKNHSKTKDGFDDDINDKLLLTCADIDIIPGKNSSIDEVTVLKQKGEQKISGPNSVDTDEMVTEEEILDMFPEDKVENAK